MDGSKFDFLTRLIAQRLSRRSTFKALTAGLAAGALGQVAVEPADAARCQTLGKSCRRRRGRPRPRCCAGSVCRGNRCQCRPNRQRCGNSCITRNQCCRNQDCPNNQRCDRQTNRCGCGNNQQRCQGRCIAASECCNGQRLCNGACIPENDVCEMQVTPSNLRGWIPRGENVFAPPELTTFVTGPGTPPVGTGSVQLDPVTTDDQAVIRTLKYAGEKIADITRLSFSLYRPAGGDAPSMQLAINGASTDPPSESGFASLIYFPGQNGNPTPDDNVWVDQDGLAGIWQSTRNILDANGECVICRRNVAPTGVCDNAGACAGVTDADWATIVSAMPDAFLNGTSEGDGGFSFRIGTGDTGQGNLTNVVYNNDGYFFEPDN